MDLLLLSLTMPEPFSTVEAWSFGVLDLEQHSPYRVRKAQASQHGIALTGAIVAARLCQRRTWHLNQPMPTARADGVSPEDDEESIVGAVRENGEHTSGTCVG